MFSWDRTFFYSVLLAQMPQTRVLLGIENCAKILFIILSKASSYCSALVSTNPLPAPWQISHWTTQPSNGGVVLQGALAANQALMATTEVKKSYLGELIWYQRWLSSQTTPQQQPQVTEENIARGIFCKQSCLQKRLWWTNGSWQSNTVLTRNPKDPTYLQDSNWGQTRGSKPLYNHKNYGILHQEEQPTLEATPTRG